MEDVTYAVEQRLRLIDFLMFHYGSINRRVIMDYFGISLPCATRDIRHYLRLAPDNMIYSKGAKSYIRGIKFKRIFP